MAITNQERVGKAMELLRQGLAPYVAREFKSTHKAQADSEALRYVRDDRNLMGKPIAEWDVAGLLNLVSSSWNDMFGRMQPDVARRQMDAEVPPAPVRARHQESTHGPA